jgi:hypothetical protein
VTPCLKFVPFAAAPWPAPPSLWQRFVRIAVPSSVQCLIATFIVGAWLGSHWEYTLLTGAAAWVGTLGTAGLIAWVSED